jgi:hypothetical protein
MRERDVRVRISPATKHVNLISKNGENDRVMGREFLLLGWGLFP